MFPIDLPLPCKRLDSPVMLSYDLAFDKSQVQTFRFVEIDLRPDCFSHDQLCVDLSLPGNLNDQCILNPNEKSITKIIMRPEILST